MRTRRRRTWTATGTVPRGTFALHLSPQPPALTSPRLPVPGLRTHPPPAADPLLFGVVGPVGWHGHSGYGRIVRRALREAQKAWQPRTPGHRRSGQKFNRIYKSSSRAPASFRASEDSRP